MVCTTSIPGVKVVQTHKNSVWNKDAYEAKGLPGEFVRDQYDRVSHGHLHGLYFHAPQVMKRLITLVTGNVFFVTVDLRVGSPVFAAWEGLNLSLEGTSQIYLPEGIAYGYLGLDHSSILHTKISSNQDQDQVEVLWCDQDIAIEWPEIPITKAKSNLPSMELGDVGIDQFISYCS